MKATYKNAKSQTEKNLDTMKNRRVIPSKKARFILRNAFDDFQGISSLFTINEYGYHVIGGRRIC